MGEYGAVENRKIKPEVVHILKQCEDRILAEWETAAKRSLPPAASLSRLALRDSFPLIIDSLVEALLDARATVRLKHVSTIHAQERAYLTNYSIEQVLIEYNVLREIVIRTIESESELSSAERQAIRKTFDEGALQAAREFFHAKSATDAVTRAETLLVAHRLQALQMITEAALAYASDIDRLLSEILAMVRQTLGVDTCSILLLVDSGRSFVMRAAQGIEEKVDHNLLIPSSKGVAGHAIEVLYPVIVPDLSNVETASPVLRPAGVTSLMVVPLKIERKPIGVIQVGSLRRRDFTSDEQAHIQIVADRVAIAIDHARLYAQVQKDNEILQQERQLRERFVAALTHDLRNPLSAALAGVDLLLRHKDRSGPPSQMLSKIRESLVMIDAMVEDLLDADRVQAGRPLPLRIESVNLAAIVDDIRAEYETVRQRPLRVQHPQTVPGYWDPRALRRIIENLLANAVKYGAQNGQITLSVNVNAGGAEVVIEVHNEGNPIGEDELRTVFERFARSKSALLSDQKGWGNGLSVVCSLVEAHGGHVRAESSKERGTTFVVVLPVDCRARSEEVVSEFQEPSDDSSSHDERERRRSHR